MPQIESDDRTITIRNVVIEVERRGEKLIVPETITYQEAIQTLQRYIEQENKVVAVSEQFHAFPPDGAHALSLALQDMFGWVSLTSTPGFFGDSPPAMITVEVGPGITTQVPWGRMILPGLDGWIQTSTAADNQGRIMFVMLGQVKRKAEGLFKELGNLVRKYLHEQSLYRGKAFRLRFRDDDGEPFEMPEPHFIDLAQVKEEELVFSKPVAAAIATSVFTPLEKTQECRDHQIPLKRGVLLAGAYGVGKTLAAYVTAKKAQENGWTFVYCEKSSELSDGIRLAQNYAPGVVFCEDVDRVTEGERDYAMDELLNVIDGIDAKEQDIMVILTTNEVSNINQAMLRPGRLDDVIHITPPDAEAVERLIRLYGRGRIAEGPLPRAGEALAGKIPAVIRECLERAKLSAIRLTEPGEPLVITDEALADAAFTMQMQIELLTPKAKDERSSMEKAADRLGGHLVVAMRKEEVNKDGQTHPVVEHARR